MSSPIEGSNPSLSVTKRREEPDPAWRLPLVVREGETMVLRRKAPWHATRLPGIGERMNLLALHTDSQVGVELIRFNLTVAAVEWGVVFSSPPAHVPMFTFEPVEGDDAALERLLDAGWEPEV